MDPQNYAKDIVKKLVREGYVAYFAGGWVRDYIMKHPSSDIDIATNAPPEKILDIFPQTVLIGLSFGVVIVNMGGHQFEVSTFRKDLSYSGGRRPDKIEYSTAQEDAQRRDFTINGMFYDPLEDEIYDFVHGMEDIKAGVIRTIGDPEERFTEDRLRMIRAVRFSSRFGFNIDLQTQQALIANANSLFPAVAMERVFQEFNKMAAFPHFDHAIIELHRLGLLAVIFPSLERTHLNDIKHRVSYFPHFPKKCPTVLYLMELFPDFSLGEFVELFLYLRVSNEEIKLIEFVQKAKQILHREELTCTIDDTAWVHFFRHALSDTVLNVVSGNYSPEKRDNFLEKMYQRKERLLPHIERLLVNKPLVNASMLMRQGIVPGKLMGNLMKEVERLTIIHNFYDPDDALEMLKKNPLWPKGLNS